MDHLQHRSDLPRKLRPTSLAPLQVQTKWPKPIDGAAHAPAWPVPRDDDLSRHVDTLAHAAIKQNQRKVRSILVSALELGWWRTCEELVGPAARVTGEEWSKDRCSFLDVTLAVGLLHRSLRSVAPLAHDRRQRVRRILICSAPNAQHTLGMLLTAERLRREGWDVDLGWPFEEPPEPGRVPYDAYGASVSGPRDFAWAVEWKGAVEAAAPSADFLVGGAGAAQLARETGVASRGSGLQPLTA